MVYLRSLSCVQLRVFKEPSPSRVGPNDGARFLWSVGTEIDLLLMGSVGTEIDLLLMGSLGTEIDLLLMGLLHK